MNTQPNPHDIAYDLGPSGAASQVPALVVIANPPISIGQALIERNKAILTAALQSIGVTAVVIDYEGSGDSGDLTSFWATRSSPIAPDDGCDLGLMERLMQDKVETWIPVNPHWELFNKPEDLALQAGTLLDAFKDLAWCVLEEKKPGWEINDGSEGTVTIDVADRTVTLEHSTIYRDSWRLEI